MQQKQRRCHRHQSDQNKAKDKFAGIVDISAEQFCLLRCEKLGIRGVHPCNMGEFFSIARHLVNENDAVSHVDGDIFAAPDLFDLAVGIGVRDAQHIPVGKIFRRIGDFLVHRED